MGMGLGGSTGGGSGNSTPVQIDQAGGTGSVYGTLTGAINGSNTDFTVSQGIYPSGKLIVSLNGQIQTQGSNEDWVELNPAAGTFRFNVAPPIGSIILVEYGRTSVAGTVAWGSVTGALSSQVDLLSALNAKITKAGDTGIGALVFAAGGTTAGTAPIKLTTQAAPLTNVEQGTFELVGNSLQFSQLFRRRGVMMSQGVLLADITVANTVTESGAIITAEHGANYLEVGKSERIEIRGVISQRNNGAAFGRIRIKYAGVTIQTITTPASVAMTNVPFTITVLSTIRSTGVSGTIRIDGFAEFGAGVTTDPGVGGVTTIDATTAQNTTVTFQWNEANAANTVTFTQGHTICIEPDK
jgi:hypothetical protein